MELGPALWLMDGFRKGMFKQSDAGCLGEEKDSRGASACPVSPHTLLHQCLIISEFKLMFIYCASLYVSVHVTEHISYVYLV